ncbi:ABC transporter ATP-binding protein/permease [Myxococcota bacterium]|nr:ABC transporter ATP-binding protein/permease [Myxococcota bacterium]MCZ7618615.1 ABC transporter ATP-binding protein/permease [Myxococcota bacterium]
MSAAAEAPTGAAAAEAAPRGFARLLGYLRHNRGTYLLGALATLCYAASFAAVPVLVGWAIQALEQGLSQAEVVRRCALLAAATGARGALRFSSRTLLFNGARQIEYELRNDLFAHLQRLPQSFFQRWRTGDLMSRCINDLASVRLMLGPGVLSVVQTPILYLFVIGAMVSLNPLLAGLVLLPYPAFLWIARSFGRSMHRGNLDVQEGLAALGSQLQETISGISVVKTYAMEPAASARFDAANERLFAAQLGLIRVNSAMPAITSMLPAAATWIVLYVGGHLIAEGRMSVAEFFTFAMFIYELTFPTFIMGWVFALVQRGRAALQRIDEVLGTAPSIADRPDVVARGPLRGEIEFRRLSFRYDAGREPALRDVSLHVPAGSVLGIVGPIGAGKTTLASLIPRLLEVPDGQLFLDGVDINRIPLRTLRSSIAMVPQDGFLFSMSLAENVAYGLPSLDRERVIEAATRAQLAKDVAELPHGWETLVGERGIMLSGGQRQRTTLARALALRPSILILDDTLASVDAETEAAIRQELRQVFAGRTVLVISHRIASVCEADRIAVLDDGRLVESGSHLELLARGGLYARLASEQALDDELVEALDHLAGDGTART